MSIRIIDMASVLASVTYGYETPLLSTIHLNYIQSPERHEYEVVGDKGWVMLDMLKGIMEIGLRSTATTEIKTYSVDRDDLFRAEWDTFILAAEGRKKIENPADEAILSTMMCEGALASWRGNGSYCLKKLINKVKSI